MLNSLDDRRLHLIEETGSLPLSSIQGTSKSLSEREPPDRAQRQQYVHHRVAFLRQSRVPDHCLGDSGTIYPPCPLAPTLATKEILRQLRETGADSASLGKSPLRHLAFARDSPGTHPRMPHALTMPHSGFQALILCGPGIGLSTFTSVPHEYPKALINVANRPMVWYVLDWCYRMGVTDITIITPPSSESAIAAALGQNPYLTSLPSPSPDLLAPPDLDHTTPTAALLRLKEVQAAIHSDFLLLPCDLICDVPGETLLESYFSTLGTLGGVGFQSGSELEPFATHGLGGEKSGRRGGLSVWYNTSHREESVKHEECDFMCTAKLDSSWSTARSARPGSADQARGTIRKLVWAMPMSELYDECEENKSCRIRASIQTRYGSVKCLTQYRDSHIYIFPQWVKDFARHNDEFESVSEDLVGTWAKCQWRKPSYRSRYHLRETFARKRRPSRSTFSADDTQIEDEVDLLSLSSTRTKQNVLDAPLPGKPGALLASRVQADPDDSILSPDNESDEEHPDGQWPAIPPMLSYIFPSTPDASLVRRVDSTPLLLSVSLLLAKTPSVEEAAVNKTPNSPFAHPAKVAATASIAQKVTISRADSLIDSNTTVATQCVIKTSVIGASVTIGVGARITNCLIMDGAIIGDKSVLTGTVIGKKAKIGKNSILNNCEVQDGNVLSDRTEGKGEKYLVGGLGDDMDGDDGYEDDDHEERNEADEGAISQGE